MHVSLTVDRIVRAVRRNMRDCDSYTGFCTSCGKTRPGCEPDAREYPCPKCKTNTVYGAEELLLMVQP